MSCLLTDHSVPRDGVEDAPADNHCLQTLWDKMDTEKRGGETES